ncbi:MAG: hypothetical protein ACE5HE_00220 [Phycisphaerae bacterium]
MSWIGVDLDGTLAHYDGWHGTGNIGEPIPAMVARVKSWLAQGKEIRIFIARISKPAVKTSGQTREEVRAPIQDWCQKHIGRILPITCTKDFACIEIWDDRAVQVVPNTGLRADGKED